MIHILVYAVVSVMAAAAIAIVLQKLNANIEPVEEKDEDPKVVKDQQKAFCQTVRFAMRMKRKIRRFKEKKNVSRKKTL